MNCAVLPDDSAVSPVINSLDDTCQAVRSPAVAPGPWSLLVAQIQAGDPAAIEQLYKHLQRGVRYYLCRQLGPDELDDKVHDTFLIVVKAIQKGDVREPERLMGFVRTIVHRQIAAQIEVNVERRARGVDEESPSHQIADRRQNPEEELRRRELADLIKKSLAQLCPRNQEILRRFYLLEQDQLQIQREMNLTETQVRLFKSRAKKRFGDIGRQHLAGKQSSLRGLRTMTVAATG